MKNSIKLAISLSLVLFVTTGCSTKTALAVPDKPAIELYSMAQQSLQAGNFMSAVETLEALDTRYPFGPHTVQVQLDLIYAYYKNNDTAQALANIDRFIRLNPTHKDIDYVYYMRGLTNMGADYNLFHDLFNIDRSDRDPSYANAAFNDFARLIQRYPDSEYVADAQKRAIAVKSRLARYELSAAEYYMKRKAYIAAIQRAQYVLDNFSDTESRTSALKVMVKAYDILEQPQLKANAETILAANN
ncbi:MAG: outer membrane protein assembly factor BamD [Moritella sp.]|jgi:outer membrane protein assembly factor BamD